MRKAVIGALVALAAGFALLAAGGAATTAGDPLNGKGIVTESSNGLAQGATQQLVNLDGDVRLVFTGTNCRDALYSDGLVKVRACSTQDDLGGNGGTWRGTQFNGWNPPAPLGHSDEMTWARKYNNYQTCSGPNGSCVSFPDGYTAQWFTDETKSSSETIWAQFGGWYGVNHWCSRLFFAENGTDSEQTLAGSSC